MKNNKIISFLAFSIFSILLLSCNNDDDNYEDTRIPKPTVTVNTKTATAAEGSVITFTLTIDKPIANAIDYKIELASGSTGQFRDYVSSGEETTLGEAGFGQGIIGHKLVFPATATTATFTITPVIDLLTEGSELLKIRLSSSGNGLGLVAADSEIINITVTDFVSANVGVRLEWGQDTTDKHGTISPGEYLGNDNLKHTYDLYDMDLYVTDAGGNPISFDGGTGAPVENTSLPATSPNGDYYVFVDQYGTIPVPQRPKTPFNLKMKVSLSKYSTWSSVIEVPFNSSAIFSANVVKITKVGNIYTVKDIVTNATIVSGRNSLPVGVKNFRKQLLDKRK